MIKIYHNPRCKKSRAGLQYLEGKGLEFELVEYLKYPLAEDDLKDILMKMNVRPVELVRTQEEKYKKELKGKDFTDEEWVKIILENPKLLKRPLIVKDYKAVWADPPENMDKLF
ncbi:MAG: arsenate reductase (glutaredoxin) [Bacteroidales bacterium]|nr:arsenate reductase (glutaredoxin) [Bacteroidales bacterium]MCF8404696.1 arsenate reductase (glutaredoxin) [Bacteroidales bacterium]